MNVISFVNQKGGVAKTTTCLSIGAALANFGKRVLLIDLDPQGSLSISTGVELSINDLTTYELLMKEDVETVKVQIGENLDILPADIRLSGAEIELSSAPGRNYLLKEALETVSNYDYVLIDCPPSLGVLTLIALTASDELIIPVKADYLALRGMSQLMDVIRAVRNKTNEDLEIGGILVTFYDGRRNLDRQTVDMVEEVFPGKVYKTKINQNTALGEAPATGKNIFQYDPKSKGAKQYKAVTEELLKEG